MAVQRRVLSLLSPIIVLCCILSAGLLFRAHLSQRLRRHRPSNTPTETVGFSALSDSLGHFTLLGKPAQHGDVASALQLSRTSGASPSATSAGKASGPTVIAEPASDLQANLEVLPRKDEVGWLGGDSDVSLVIGGGSTGRRALWIFADSFIGKRDVEIQAREKKGVSMPHSTIALAECGKCDCQGKPRFVWKKNNSKVVSFFHPSAEKQNKGEVLWPVAGIASRDGNTVVLLAQRVRGFLNVIGTSIIVVHDVAKVQNPIDWIYTVYDVGNQNLTWFSSIFYASSDDEVYLFGHSADAMGNPATQYSPTFLAKTTLSDLIEQKWERTHYWVWPSVWSAEPRGLQAIGVPAWETTCAWSSSLGLWYSFNIEPFGNAIFMYTAKDITGYWEKSKIYDLPHPFTEDEWLNYAAKAHPELEKKTCESGRPRSTKELELVLTWIPNYFVESEQAVLDSPLFAPGGMEWNQRGYWPRFVRVKLRRAKRSKKTLALHN